MTNAVDTFSLPLRDLLNGDGVRGRGTCPAVTWKRRALSMLLPSLPTYDVEPRALCTRETEISS